MGSFHRDLLSVEGDLTLRLVRLRRRILGRVFVLTFVFRAYPLLTWAANEQPLNPATQHRRVA
jgi:hypothetical protein